MNNNIVLDKQSYVKLQHSIAKDNQPSIKTIYNRQQNIIQEVRIKNLDKEVFVDIKAPFAAGTYIRLEAIQQQNDTINDAGALNTIYWREKLYARKPNDKDFEIMPHESRQTFITGQYIQAFYLSTPKEIDLLRQKGYVDFTYIIYASSIKHFDNNTTQLKFNLNFEVGIGNDDNVRESIRNYQQTTTKSTIKKPNYNQQYIYNNAINDTISQQDRLKYFNQLEHIYSVAEAVAFLKVLPQEAKDDFSKYVIQNPQIACKIAYIYYRFDLGNDKFISSVEGKDGEYQKDRQNFIDKVEEVFKNGTYESKIFGRNIRFREAYSNPLFDGYSLFSSQLNKKNGKILYNERKSFVINFIKQICNGIDIIISKAEVKSIKNRGETFVKKQKIIIDKKLLELSNTISNKSKQPAFYYQSDRLIGTIIHECRHLYNYQKIYKTTTHESSDLLKYLAYCRKFLISSARLKTKPNVLESYQKECKQNEHNAVYCKKEESQNAYRIQPNERDPRYVANKAIENLRIKQK